MLRAWKWLHTRDGKEAQRPVRAERTGADELVEDAMEAYFADRLEVSKMLDRR